MNLLESPYCSYVSASIDDLQLFRDTSRSIELSNVNINGMVKHNRSLTDQAFSLLFFLYVDVSKYNEIFID